MMQALTVLIIILGYATVCMAGYCNSVEKSDSLQYHLLRQCQRSIRDIIYLENVENLDECINLAKEKLAMAFNYSPTSRRRNIRSHEERLNGDTSVRAPKRLERNNQNFDHFWNYSQEYFNCHLLQCPESTVSRTMVNDSRFDYFGLYQPIELKNYKCLPGIGIVLMGQVKLSYDNATEACKHLTANRGNLIDIISERRTRAIADLLRQLKNNTRRDDASRQKLPSAAYVGLRFNGIVNDFLTPDNKSLSCYMFHAWGPGYPRRSVLSTNTSCVALTMESTWITVDCNRKLPYICELYPSTELDFSDYAFEHCN